MAKEKDTTAAVETATETPATTAARPLPAAKRAEPRVKAEPPKVAKESALEEIRRLQADLAKVTTERDKAVRRLAEVTGAEIKLVALKDITVGAGRKTTGQQVGVIDMVGSVDSDWLVKQLADGAIGIN